MMMTTQLAEKLLLSTVQGRLDSHTHDPEIIAEYCKRLAVELHKRLSEIEPVVATKWLVPHGYKLVKEDSK